jgi:hypothetical protein
MSQIKFSQKSIQGLPEALAALLAQLNTQGAAGSTALTTAINAEVAARTAADTEISNALAIVNGASNVEGSFRKAIADVIGSAPEALNTLKEIADYISVNPSANVADAINAAIASANQSVTDLTAAFNAEKTYLDNIVSGLPQIYTDSAVAINNSNLSGTDVIIPANYFSAPPMEILNFGTVRVTSADLSLIIDIPATVLGFDNSIKFSIAGYETEIGDLDAATFAINYVTWVDGASLR